MRSTTTTPKPSQRRLREFAQHRCRRIRAAASVTEGNPTASLIAAVACGATLLAEKLSDASKVT
jgi:hypothetical protein